MSKYDDYNHVVKVIQSCVTSGQNNTAYRMVWNWNNLYKDYTLSLQLFRLCDENLIELLNHE